MDDLELSFVALEPICEELKTMGEEVMIIRFLKDSSASDVAHKVLEEWSDDYIYDLSQNQIDLQKECVSNHRFSSYRGHVERLEIFATNDILLSSRVIKFI